MNMEEIQEYAVLLGMNREGDEEFFYIAREGLKAPLPSPWKPCKTLEGEIFYFNFSTGESTWDHPCDEHFRELYEKERDNPEREANRAERVVSWEFVGCSKVRRGVVDSLPIGAMAAGGSAPRRRWSRAD